MQGAGEFFFGEVFAGQPEMHALPGFLLAVDTSGHVVYQSPEVRALNDQDLATLQDQLKLVPVSGQALLLQLDSLGQRVLLISETLPDEPGGIARI